MKRIAKQLIAALVTTFLALGLSIGIAGAGSDMGGHDGDHKSNGSGVSQSLTQRAYTNQSGNSDQKNVQFIPVNFNASFLGKGGDMKPPTGMYGYGLGGECSRTCDDHFGKPSHGDDVTQKNEASPTNVRVNKAFTGQFAHQDQDVTVAHGSGGSHSCNDKCGNQKGDDKQYRPDGNHDRCEKCDHREAKGPHVSQDLDQSARTDQSGNSNQRNWQILPINANFGAPHSGGSAPWSGKDGKDCGCSDHKGKGYGRSGSEVTQKNEASPTNIRINEAETVQWADQDQDVTGKSSGGQDWHPRSNDCGCSQHGKDGGYDKPDQHGPDGSGVSQDADQHAGTDQSGDSNQENWQVAPINVNAPISVLSVGSNNGEVRQSNEASPTNVRENEAFTGQVAGQNQDVSQPAWGGGDGAVSQDGDQSSYTDQSGDSNQKNVQVLPINVNAPISVLSHGSNSDDVSQSNEASPTNYRSNEAGTFQGIGQSQAVGSLT